MIETRFKDMEIGLIPEDWEVKPIKNICDVKRGVRVTRDMLSPEGEYPVFQNTNYPLGYFNKYNVEANTPYVIVGGSAGLIGVCNLNYWAADDCVYFSKKEGLDHVFLYYELLHRQFDIKKHVRSASVPRLDRKVIENLVISVPLIDEQKRIASALSDVDVLLRELGELIAKKKAIKMGMMQELLTVEAVPGKEGAFRPKRRLEGFEGDWVEKRLGEIGVTFNGLTGKSAADFGTGKSRYITFLNVLNNPVIDLSILEKVDVKVGEKQNAVKRNDLLFNTSSETPEEVGICSVLLDDVVDVYLNSFCFGYRLTDDEVWDYTLHIFSDARMVGI